MDRGEEQRKRRAGKEEEEEEGEGNGLRPRRGRGEDTVRTEVSERAPAASRGTVYRSGAIRQMLADMVLKGGRKEERGVQKKRGKKLSPTKKKKKGSAGAEVTCGDGMGRGRRRGGEEAKEGSGGEREPRPLRGGLGDSAAGA
ncbi:hypothetical protein EYF80_056456 [Liparis tanakae]|uniref:Uncharacterized protein n=1 Tax=Liparis tanakae TaxID=230148 RepID=A0A4Z2EXA4_9TELE|nr:hypothetical protein EYF80_056456 [Liparis tanakae]